MTMSEPSTTPKRELPAEIEAAIVKLCWYAIPYDAQDTPTYLDAANELRSAILAALEPERALSPDTVIVKRADLDELQRVYWLWFNRLHQIAELVKDLPPPLPADNLTATSSTHEGREETK